MHCRYGELVWYRAWRHKKCRLETLLTLICVPCDFALHQLATAPPARSGHPECLLADAWERLRLLASYNQVRFKARLAALPRNVPQSWQRVPRASSGNPRATALSPHRLSMLGTYCRSRPMILARCWSERRTWAPSGSSSATLVSSCADCFFGVRLRQGQERAACVQAAAWLGAGLPGRGQLCPRISACPPGPLSSRPCLPTRHHPALPARRRAPRARQGGAERVGQ